MEKITYKGRFGTVTQDVEYINDVNLPNIMETTIYCGDDTPKVGEEVFLSSCDIPYHNNITDSWTVRPYDDELFANVVVELIDYDDSNYEPSKSRNGGHYLDSRWVIREIKDVYTFAEL